MKPRNDEPATIAMPRIEALPTRDQEDPTRPIGTARRTAALEMSEEIATRTMASSLLAGMLGADTPRSTTKPFPATPAIVRQTETIVRPRTSQHIPLGLSALALVIAFSVVAGGFLMREDSREPDPSSATCATTDAVSAPAKQALAVSKEKAVQPAPLALPSTMPKETTVDAAALAQPSTSAAVEHLIAGRHLDALTAYRALAIAAPEQPVYAAIVTILEARTMAHCKARAESGDAPCD